MFDLDLTGNVPLYGQYQSNYCGSASAQMIMNGYPDPAARLLVHQKDIYDWIQAQQVAAGEPSPYKIPNRVRDAIHHFNPPPGTAHFVAVAFDNAPEAIYRVALWMRRTNYPAAVVINGGHWSVIAGYTTDVDPEGNSSVTLESIDLYDPLPFCPTGSGDPLTWPHPPTHGTAKENLVGTTFYDPANPGSCYLRPVTLWAGTSWNGKFCAVYEPPEERGRVRVRALEVGPRIIRDLNLIRERAAEAVSARGLLERRGMDAFENAMPGEPILARVRARGGRSYYIVPFERRRLQRARAEVAVQAAVIVNAYKGVYEQAISLTGDCFLRYLRAEVALKLALKEIPEPLKYVNAPRLVFEPSAETPNRFLPVWQVIMPRRRAQVFVTPTREVVRRLAATEDEFYDRARRRLFRRTQ